MWNTPLPLLQWGVVITASIAAAACDTFKHRIPNYLTVPLLVAGFIFSGVNSGLSGIGDSLVGCIVLAFPYVLLFIVAGGGAGDAKMMGAIGAWLGIINGLFLLAAVSVCAVILGLLFLTYRRGISSLAPAANAGAMSILSFFFAKGKIPLKNNNEIKPEPLAKMPYGLAIMTGAIVAAVIVSLYRN